MWFGSPTLGEKPSRNGQGTTRNARSSLLSPVPPPPSSVHDPGAIRLPHRGSPMDEPRFVLNIKTSDFPVYYDILPEAVYVPKVGLPHSATLPGSCRLAAPSDSHDSVLPGSNVIIENCRLGAIGCSLLA